MIIANPIYDVVFKYLLADRKIAKFMLSKFLDKEIIKLEYNPTELNLKDEVLKKVKEEFKKDYDISVLYMDFAATVLDDNGNEEIIIIELQKARDHADVTRFRHYLGSQYINENNNYETILKSGKRIKTGRHIQAVYLLGHKLESPKYSKYLAINNIGNLTDAITKKTIEKGEDPFVDSLTHDSLFIQLPNIKRYKKKNKLKNNLTTLLSIFDQSKDNRHDTQGHRLNIEDEMFPKVFQPLIRRLIQAGSDVVVAERMTKEDIVLDELTRAKIQCREQQEEIEKNQEEKIKMILDMHKNNMEIDMIATYTKATLNEIKQIITTEIND